MFAISLSTSVLNSDFVVFVRLSHRVRQVLGPEMTRSVSHS